MSETLLNPYFGEFGGMYVEVPLSTFNPVKTVNDLLRPEHQ